MSNEDVARRYFEEMVRTHDLSICDEVLTEDYVDHDAPRGTAPGRESAKAFAGALLSHHPDLLITIEDLFGAGDRLALRLRWSAPETGYHQYGIVLLRFDGDRIAERWSAYMTA